MIVENPEIARPPTQRRGRPDMAFSLLLVLVFVGAESALITRARVRILGALSAARAGDASSALGGGLEPVLAERVRRIVEDETGAGARAYNQDNCHQARVWWPCDRRHLMRWRSARALEMVELWSGWAEHRVPRMRARAN